MAVVSDRAYTSDIDAEILRLKLELEGAHRQVDAVRNRIELLTELKRRRRDTSL